MRFVSPETVRIGLRADPDGTKNWIEVKKYLTAGETHAFRMAGFQRVSKREGSAETEVGIDWREIAIAKVKAYLVDWSARDRRDKPVPITDETIRQLSPEQFDEIEEAIEKHRQAMEDEKNGERTTSSDSSSTATSSSSDTPAGPGPSI